MSKTLSILGVCAIIAGVSAYAMYGNVENKPACTGCHTGHVNATVEPACGHSHDADTTECATSPCCASKVSVKAAKESCCSATAACCPGACCDDAVLAIAGPAAAVSLSKVSTATKASCCATACCDSPLSAIDGVAGCGAANAAAKVK